MNDDLSRMRSEWNDPLGANTMSDAKDYIRALENEMVEAIKFAEGRLCNHPDPDQLRDHLQAAAEFIKAHRWIPVEERLPDVGMKVQFKLFDETVCNGEYNGDWLWCLPDAEISMPSTKWFVGNRYVIAWRESRKAKKCTRHSDTCKWKQDTNGIWFTSCGGAWEFTADGPVDNSVVYCPYCGKKLNLAHSPPEPE